MATYKNIAVAGASGNLGPTIVQALVQAGFEVTILSRSGKVDGIGIDIDPKRVFKVDYNSLESMTAALQGQDVVVSNLPNHDGQKLLIDAAIAAGVKHYLPSEFGLDVYNDPELAHLAPFKKKVVIQQYLQSKSAAISWTHVVTGLFLDWGLVRGFQINPKGTTRLFNDGNKRFSTTVLVDIGKAVVGVLNHPEETKNRAVYVQSACVTQNELLAIAKKVNPSYSAETRAVNTEQLTKESNIMLDKGEDIGTAIVSLICVGVFGEKYLSSWDTNNDNELFGIKNLSEEELEKVVLSSFS